MVPRCVVNIQLQILSFAPTLLNFTLSSFSVRSRGTTFSLRGGGEGGEGGGTPGKLKSSRGGLQKKSGCLGKTKKFTGGSPENSKKRGKKGSLGSLL